VIRGASAAKGFSPSRALPRCVQQGLLADEKEDMVTHGTAQAARVAMARCPHAPDVAVWWNSKVPRVNVFKGSRAGHAGAGGGKGQQRYRLRQALKR